MKLCVAAAVEALMQKERQDETQFTTKPTKLVEKLVWVPVISFGKRPVHTSLQIFGQGLFVFFFRFNDVDLSGNHPQQDRAKNSLSSIIIPASFGN